MEPLDEYGEGIIVPAGDSIDAAWTKSLAGLAECLALDLDWVHSGVRAQTKDDMDVLVFWFAEARPARVVAPAQIVAAEECSAPVENVTCLEYGNLMYARVPFPVPEAIPAHVREVVLADAAKHPVTRKLDVEVLKAPFPIRLWAEYEMVHVPATEYEEAFEYRRGIGEPLPDVCIATYGWYVLVPA